MRKIILLAVLAAALSGSLSSCASKLCPAYGNSHHR
ncbi:MAG: lipoprotein [Janthinobacterium lividum]